MNTQPTTPTTPIRSIVVTRTDLTRLQELLQSQFAAAVGEGRPHLTELNDLLERAEPVDPQSMLPHIVTMNSTIKLLDVKQEEAETYTLVYPEEACIAEGKLSILSPLGSQLLGRHVGEEVAFNVSDRKIYKRVEKIWFQPERAGAFNL